MLHSGRGQHTQGLSLESHKEHLRYCGVHKIFLTGSLSHIFQMITNALATYPALLHVSYASRQSETMICVERKIASRVM